MAKLERYKNYEANENGSILGLNKGDLLSPYPAGKGKKREGYLKIKLYRDDGKRVTWYVSRFIYMAFLGVIPQGFEIDHIDKNRSNNAISNLRILPHDQNMRRIKK